MQGDATKGRVFEKVWYRAHPVRLRDLTVRAMEDVGTLFVEDGRLVFVGMKESLEVSNVVAVSRGRHGIDHVNNWITVTYQPAIGQPERSRQSPGRSLTGGPRCQTRDAQYGSERTAMFVDGRRGGWRGILGGNRVLYQAIMEAFDDALAG